VALKAGPSLAPGKATCEARDLITYFGSGEDDSTSAFARFRWGSLAPGRYRFVARYSLHTGFDRTLPPQALSSDTLRFEVLPLSSAPAEERLLDQFVAGTARYGPKTGEYFEAVRRMLPRFYESRFLLRMFRECGPEMSRVSTEAVLDSLARHGVNETRRAAFVGIRAQIDPRAKERDSQTHSRMRAHAQSDLERRMIDSWERSQERR
jgi:hypothetical protein